MQVHRNPNHKTLFLKRSGQRRRLECVEAEKRGDEGEIQNAARPDYLAFTIFDCRLGRFSHVGLDAVELQKLVYDTQ